MTRAAPHRLTLWAMLAFGLLWLATVHADLGDLAGDSAKYVALARALVTGHGYRSIYLVGSPLHGEVPPLFPLALAPIVAIVGLNAWWLHLWMVILAIVALALVRQCLRLRTDDTTALLATLLTGSSVIWWDGVSRIMSDVPFVGVVALACVWLERYRQTTTVTRSVWCVAFVGVMAAFLTRTVGVLLVSAAALTLLRTGRVAQRSSDWRRRTIALVMWWLVVCGAWWAYVTYAGRHTNGPFYLTQWQLAQPMGPVAAPLDAVTFWQRIVWNVRYYAAEAARIVCPPHEHVSPWPEVTAWLFLGVAIVGARRLWHSAEAVEWCFLLLYGGAVLLWSYRDSRFLLPLVPWLWLSFLTGLRRLLRLNIYAIIVVGLVVFQSVAMGGEMRRHLADTLLGAHQRAFIAANRWFAGHTPADSVILSSKPSVTWWYSGRQAMPYPPIPSGASAAEVRAALRSQPAEYLLLDAFAANVNRVIVPALVGETRDLRLAAVFGETLILQRVRRSPTAPSRP